MNMVHLTPTKMQHDRKIKKINSQDIVVTTITFSSNLALYQKYPLTAQSL